MSIDFFSLLISLFFIAIFLFFSWKKPNISIIILRLFTILTSLASVGIFLLIDSRPININIFTQSLHMYTFISHYLLYLIPIILVIYDMYYLIKSKYMKYFYYILFIDIFIPSIGLYYYNKFFSNVLF